MRIGIDAKWYFRGPPSGRRVIRSLVHALIAVAGAEDELHFFLDDRSRGEIPEGAHRAQCRYVWGRVNQLGNLYPIPRAADALSLDVVVYQNFAPPRAVAHHARIAFVHDVIFAERPEFYTWQERAYFAPLRALSTRADRVCTVSESEKTRLVRLGYADEQRVDVVPNAVDDVFVARDALEPCHVAETLRARGLREPFVLFVGRVTARKNVGALVSAMALVATPGLTLVVAGPADRTSRDLAAALDASGVSERVRFIGLVDDESLRVLYASAALFCFPSLDESFGFPPLEAMAAGTPTIVSRIPALEETCGHAALYVDATDPADIARAIDELMSDPARRAVLRDEGFRQASKFVWRDSAQRLLGSARAALAGAV